MSTYSCDSCGDEVYEEYRDIYDGLCHDCAVEEVSAGIEAGDSEYGSNVECPVCGDMVDGDDMYCFDCDVEIMDV